MSRAESAVTFWDKHWQEMLPLDGKRHGWVLQAHWRGLSEEEAKTASLEDLLATDHSLHFDWRFEYNREWLWGRTIPAGTAEENQRRLRVALLSPEKPMVALPKLAQPHDWLDVGKGSPYVAEPQEVGATSLKWAKFFALDWGEYLMGVARQHLVEVFVVSSEKGLIKESRTLFEYAQLGQDRQWLAVQPKDQTPYAKNHKLKDVVQELRSKGQKWLIWGLPGEPLKRLNLSADVVKADAEKHLVWVVVMKPYFVDFEGHWSSPETIEDAAHRWLLRGGRVFLEHAKDISDKVKVVESYVLLDDLRLNGRTVPKGSWIAVFWVADSRLWQAVKEGALIGGSVRGIANLVEKPSPKR